ncbi:MAG TPA: acyl-CoA carboxylase subunit epsilon [Beutenbergiaceae bacterium]|nr:acyl-CoA carboxylase subunit epsilon [Beutenbergiaceae bacterium]
MTSSPKATQPEIDRIAQAVSQALPGIKVVKGQPDEEELAALVASIVSARANYTDRDRGTSVWKDPQHRWGLPPTPGASAWRWSAHRTW